MVIVYLELGCDHVNSLNTASCWNDRQRTKKRHNPITGNILVAHQQGDLVLSNKNKSSIIGVKCQSVI